MVDKVLQRRLFREKALKKYGGDMLPKFQDGGESETQNNEFDFDPMNIIKAFGLGSFDTDVPRNIQYNDKLDKYHKITDIIDISGSLETSGEKDFSKINIFLENIKRIKYEN